MFSSFLFLGIMKMGSSYNSIMGWGKIIHFFLISNELQIVVLRLAEIHWVNRKPLFMENMPPVNSLLLCIFNFDSECGVFNITGCQWGYNHVFLSHIPQVFVSEASRLLTANGIALHLLRVWSRGDKAGDECGVCAVRCKAEMCWKLSFICERSVWNGGSESSDMSYLP